MKLGFIALALMGVAATPIQSLGAEGVPLAMHQLASQFVDLRRHTVYPAQERAGTLAMAEAARVRAGPRIFVGQATQIANNNYPQRMPRDPVRASDFFAGVQFPLFNRKLKGDIAVADAQTGLASSQMDLALEIELLQLVDRFGDIATATEQLEAVARFRDGLSDLARLVQASTAAGLLPVNAVSEVEVAAARALRVSESLTSDRELALQELETLLRRNLGEYSAIRMEFLLMPAIRRVLGMSCDVTSSAMRVAQNRVELARNEQVRYKADGMPTADIETGVRRRNQDIGSPTQIKTNSAEVALRLNWDIGYTGLGREVLHHSAEKLNLALQGLEEESRRSRSGCDATKVSLAKTENDVRLVQAQRERALALLAHKKSRYETAGFRAVTIEELVGAESLLYEASTDLVRARRALAALHWRLKFAVRAAVVEGAVLSEAELP